MVYGDLGESEVNNIRRKLGAFLEDKNQIPEVINIGYTRAIFREMREMIIEAMEGKRSMVKLSPRATIKDREEHFEVAHGEHGEEGVQVQAQKQQPQEKLFSPEKIKLSEKFSPTSDAYLKQRNTEGKGNMDNNNNNSISNPLSNSKKDKNRPPLFPEKSDSPKLAQQQHQQHPQHQQHQQHQQQQQLQLQLQQQHPQVPPVIKPSLVDPNILNKQKLFNDFKYNAGASKNAALTEAKTKMKEQRGVVKDLINEVNYQKDRIDFLLSQLGKGNGGGGSPPRREGGDGGNMGNISPRSGDPALQLKAAKKAYRLKMELLKEAKEESKYLTHIKDKSFQELLAGFELYTAMIGDDEDEDEDEDEEDVDQSSYSPPQTHESERRSPQQHNSNNFDFDRSAQNEQHAFEQAQKKANFQQKTLSRNNSKSGRDFNRSGEWIR